MGQKFYPKTVQRTLAIAAVQRISCEAIFHDQSGNTSEKAAKILGVDLAAVIKTLVLESDKGFAVAIIAGNERLDFKIAARHLGCKRVCLASPKRVKEFSGYEIGGVPPIVFRGKCRVLLSDSLLNSQFCYGSAGDPCVCLKLLVSSLVDFYKPVVFLAIKRKN